MTPSEFVQKWQDPGPEHASAQPHFNDLCRMLGEADPQAADPQRARRISYGASRGWFRATPTASCLSTKRRPKS